MAQLSDYYITCAISGLKVPRNQARRNWKGQLVHPDFWEEKDAKLRMRKPEIDRPATDSASPVHNWPTNGTDADDDAICTAQVIGATGAMTLNGTLVSGSVATMDATRGVTVTTTGDDHGLVILIQGTRNGSSVVDRIKTVDQGTVYGMTMFDTVTAVTSDKPSTDTVKIGTRPIVDHATKGDL